MKPKKYQSKTRLALTKPNPHFVAKREKPSLYKKKRLEQAVVKLQKEIQENYGVSKEEALTIATNDDAFKQVLKYEEKYWTLKMIRELMPTLHETVRKKAETGWTANARDGMTAIAILTDKAFREGFKETTKLNIGGKNVQINLGFGFKPYKENKDEKELKA